MADDMSKVARSMILVGDMNPDFPECPECPDGGDVFEGSSKKNEPDRIGGRENELLAGMGLSTLIGGDDRSSLSRAQNKGADRMHEMYKRVHESKLIKRRSDALFAAILFIVCKQQNVARTLHEVRDVASVPEKELRRFISQIKTAKLYKIQLPGAGPGGPPAGSLAAKSSVLAGTQSEQLLSRFCNFLKLPMQMTTLATHIAERVHIAGINAGKRPATIAGACLYLACRLSKTEWQRSLEQIAEVVGMAPSTVRSAFEPIYQNRRALLPPEFVPYTSVDALPLLEVKRDTPSPTTIQAPMSSGAGAGAGAGPGAGMGMPSSGFGSGSGAAVAFAKGSGSGSVNGLAIAQQQRTRLGSGLVSVPASAPALSAGAQMASLPSLQLPNLGSGLPMMGFGLGSPVQAERITAPPLPSFSIPQRK